MANHLGETLLRLRHTVSNCCRSYRSVVLRDFGKPLEIQDSTKEPHISRKEVLVKVHSAGVNYSDLLITKGKYHLKPVLPFTPGFELAGEVESVGKDVTKFSPGDRVLALKTVSTGAFAENKVVLVLTSQGASGIAVIDLALSVFRCQVIVASDSEQKLQMVRPDGVLATVTYTDESLVKQVLRYAKDGVDIIVDTVGGPWFAEAINCIKPGGRILSLSYTSGESPKIDVQTLIQHRASVHGVSLSGLAEDKPEVFHSIIETIVNFIDQQYVTPHTGAVFTLEQVAEAMEFIDKKSAFGKVILKIVP